MSNNYSNRVWEKDNIALPDGVVSIPSESIAINDSCSGNALEESYTGSFQLRYIQLGGHALDVVGGDRTITCAACEMEMKIPELVRESGGFLVVVWRLYLLGVFASSPCYGRDDPLDSDWPNPGSTAKGSGNGRTPSPKNGRIWQSQYII